MIELIILRTRTPLLLVTVRSHPWWVVTLNLIRTRTFLVTLNTHLWWVVTLKLNFIRIWIIIPVPFLLVTLNTHPRWVVILNWIITLTVIRTSLHLVPINFHLWWGATISLDRTQTWNFTPVTFFPILPVHLLRCTTVPNCTLLIIIAVISLKTKTITKLEIDLYQDSEYHSDCERLFSGTKHRGKKGTWKSLDWY